MRSLKSGLFCLIILLAAQAALAQIMSPRPIYDPNNPPPDWMRRMEDNRRAMDKLAGKDSMGMIAGRTLAPKRVTPRKSNGKPYTREELEELRLLSAPRAEDLAAHKGFLRQPNTGIFRLFAESDCSTKNLVQVNGDCENVFFAITSYSFRKNAHLIDDIKLFNDILIADGFFSQEILVRLGDVSLNDVTLADKGMKFLGDYAAPASLEEAPKEYARFAGGVVADGHKYANKVNAENDAVYGLRLIAYKVGNDVALDLSKDYRHGRYLPEKRIFLDVKEDNRVDLTLAFRIIRKHEDGSLTILWKELKRQPAPKLTFAKGEKYRDLKGN